MKSEKVVSVDRDAVLKSVVLEEHISSVTTTDSGTPKTFRNVRGEYLT